MTVPESLTHRDLVAIWDLVADRLERVGADNRGRLRLPARSRHAQLALDSLIGRPVGATIDLAALESSLVALGIGTDLPSALARLGSPVSPLPAARRDARRAARDAREAARATAVRWPEPWAREWIDGVVRAGLLRGMDEAQAVATVEAVRLVIDRLASAAAAGGPPQSRVELAAAVLGDAHALDAGTRIEAATSRALAFLHSEPTSRRLWERAGAHTDLVSGAALTWSLPLAADHPMHTIATQSTALGIPLHLTQLALRRYPVVVAAGTTVLLVENPRVVEAAAQAQHPSTVAATNGNPSGAVQLLLTQLLACDAEVRYHGDFDAAGLAMCARLVHRGAVAWKMSAADYRSAVRAAECQGVELPVDPRAVGPTPWDPELQAVFNADHRVVHEERLITDLLDR